MPFVRRHVTRRLKTAKTDCDKELQRITNNITAFFEERLRDTDHEVERDRRERDHDSQAGDHEYLRDSFVYPQPSEFGIIQAEEYSSDGGYDADPEYSRHSRQRAYLLRNQLSTTACFTAFILISLSSYSIVICSDEPCFFQKAECRPVGSPS